jgi:hypothetical protein
MATTKILLAPLRAPEHRRFIAPVFNGTPESDEPKGLTYFDIIANPKLADLGRRVFGELKAQFADEGDTTESEETIQYRIRLEGWALALEVMLEEVLTELESLRGPAAQSQQDLI